MIKSDKVNTTNLNHINKTSKAFAKFEFDAKNQIECQHSN